MGSLELSFQGVALTSSMTSFFYSIEDTMEPLLKLFPWLFCHSADYLNCCSFESCSFFFFSLLRLISILLLIQMWNIGNHTSSFILFMLEECFVFYKLVMELLKAYFNNSCSNNSCGMLKLWASFIQTWRMRSGVVPMSWWWIIPHQCRRWSQDIQLWILFLDFQIVDLSVP